MASQLDKDIQANLNNKRVDDTFGRLVQINDKRLLDGNGNPIEPEFGGNVHISGSLTVQNVEYNTVSYISSSGDSKFGDTQDDSHEFTGSVFVTGDIIPNTANEQVLGSIEKPWKDLYVSSASIKLVSGSSANVADISFHQDELTINGVNRVSSSLFTGTFSGDGSGLINTEGIFVSKSREVTYTEGTYWTEHNLEVSGTLDIKDGILVNGQPLGATSNDSYFTLNNDNSIFYNVGNVGLGVNYPEVKLAVGGNGVLVDLDSTGNKSILQFSEQGSLRNWIGFAPSGELFDGVDDNSLQLKTHQNLYLGSGSNPLLTVHSNNNVGIGNISPSHKLDVSGNINANDIFSNTKKVLVSSDTGSLNNLNVIGDVTASGNVVVKGTLTAEQYIVSSSLTNLVTQDVSGSSLFGNSSDDTHQFTGSLSVLGNTTLNGDITATTASIDNLVLNSTDISSTIFREWKQESKLVDQTFLNAPTFSLDFTPIDNSEDVFMNGLRMTKGISFDYYINPSSLNNMIFNEEIIFRIGDVITIKYSTLS